jgi:PAS domain S-box-containing protein
MKVSIGNKLALGFVFAVTLLLGVSLLYYRTTTNLIATENWVAHTHDVIASLESGLAILTDAETQQRGYLLTGDGRFLKDCQNAQAQVGGWLNRIRTLTADNPEQRQRLARLEPLIAQRLAVLNQRIRQRQTQGFQAAAAGVASREGKDLMDSIWQSVLEMRTAENQLLQQRTAAVEHEVRMSLVFGTAGGALIFSSGLLALGALRRDLHRREQAERELQESRALMQSILDNTPAVVFLKDPDGRYLFVNRRFAELTGISRDQIIGKTGFELFRKELAETARTHDLKILETGQAMNFEETIMHPEDGPHSYLAVKFPVRDAQGKIYATAGVSQDNTERKRLEAERDRFFSLSLDFLCIASRDGYFKRVSPAVTDILGWSTGEFLARPFIDFVHPDDHAATLREVERQVVGGEKVLHFENRYRHKDGSWRVLSWRSMPDAGGLMYATARDVTEQKRDAEKINRLHADLAQRAAQLENLNKELEAFSYSVSHDLRAPLRHMNGFVSMLRKHTLDSLDEKSRRFLDIIADAAQKMGQLVDDLLNFSRMSRTEMRQGLVSLPDLVAEIRNELRPELEGRAVEWKIGALPEVRGDRAMLRLVFMNLLQNAIKYTRQRQPAVIEIGSQSANDEDVISVCDNGVGFDMQYVHKLFGVFQRLHTEEEFEGTGIGLAIVRRVVSRHGGRTWAEGKLGEGAKIYFSLPKIPNPQPLIQT